MRGRLYVARKARKPPNNKLWQISLSGSANFLFNVRLVHLIKNLHTLLELCSNLVVRLQMAYFLPRPQLHSEMESRFGTQIRIETEASEFVFLALYKY